MNNSIPSQTITPATGSVEFISRQGSSSTNTAKAQRTPQHDQANASLRNRSGKSRRGKARKSKLINVLEKAVEEVSPQAESYPKEPQLSIAVNPSNSFNGCVAKASHSRAGGGGKYRQRQQTNQLLDGLDPVSELDIEFAESIIPTVTNGSPFESNKGRHTTNSRKVNLTHLLNYKFERKQTSGRFNSSSTNDERLSSYTRTSNSQYRDTRGMHKFSKQQFLQANGQFIVLDGYDYSIHKVDPDWPVDWNCIEEIRFKQSASTETTCPICLEPPIAAKITRCGHIYCWTCMLQYLSLSDESSRPCPICFESIHKNDLRSVISHSFVNHNVGEEIVMKLMVRKKGCVEVEPYKRIVNTASSGQSEEEPSNQKDAYSSSRANLVIVDLSTVITKIVQRERNELLMKLELDKDEPEVCFIEQALIRLEKRVERLRAKSLEESKGKPQDRPKSSKQDVSASVELSRSYLFYQCSDGQHIYLNPFSTKILSHEYENLENCLLEIRANILQMDWISMSEAWRKRFKYLEHLPLTCEFRLIEIDFENSNLVSKETFSFYEDQIKKREKEREKRRREERKREKIIQVEQNRRIYGIQPSLKINLDNTEQFPSVSDERYLGITHPRNHSSVNDLLSTDEEDDESKQKDNADVESNIVNVPLPASSSEVSVSDIALSFKDIQLQQAHEALKSARIPSSSNAWGNSSKTKNSSGSPHASFAQLLLNAKSSQKEWVRKDVSSNLNSTPNQSESRNSKLYAGSNHEDEYNEQCLPPPPPEFTIRDFIDINLSSNVRKKKGKQKSTVKRS